jgi:YbgC/YbaW family acyl-CoA thioester hydrolase
MPASEEFVIHVFPNDCDMVGHVNHAHMLRFLERARWAVLEEQMTFDEYGKSNLWAVVRKVEALYHAQTFAGDDLHIRTGLLSLGTTSFVVKQEVRNQASVLVCDATFVYVTVSPDGKAIPVPEKWRNLFAPWQGSTP